MRVVRRWRVQNSSRDGADCNRDAGNFYVVLGSNACWLFTRDLSVP